MNKKIWGLQQINDRMGRLSEMMALEAAALGRDGWATANMADKLRKIAYKTNIIVERVLFGGEEMDEPGLLNIAFQLNFAALNAAVECTRLQEHGKRAAVCADMLREIAADISRLFYEQPNRPEEFVLQAEVPGQDYQFWPKNPITSQNETQHFISFSVAGICMWENVLNVIELFPATVKTDSVTLRKKEYPILDAAKLLGKSADNSAHIIIRTPWAKSDKTYAVAVDAIHGIATMPIGTAVSTPADMPLAQYVRECWENECGTQPFYFMDWLQMA